MIEINMESVGRVALAFPLLWVTLFWFMASFDNFSGGLFSKSVPKKILALAGWLLLLLLWGLLTGVIVTGEGVAG